jgi:hypothetical protein
MTSKIGERRGGNGYGGAPNSRRGEATMAMEDLEEVGRQRPWRTSGRWSAPGRSPLEWCREARLRSGGGVSAAWCRRPEMESFSGVRLACCKVARAPIGEARGRWRGAQGPGGGVERRKTDIFSEDSESRHQKRGTHGGVPLFYGCGVGSNEESLIFYFALQVNVTHVLDLAYQAYGKTVQRKNLSPNQALDSTLVFASTEHFI